MSNNDTLKVAYLLIFTKNILLINLLDFRYFMAKFGQNYWLHANYYLMNTFLYSRSWSTMQRKIPFIPLAYNNNHWVCSKDKKYSWFWHMSHAVSNNLQIHVACMTWLVGLELMPSKCMAAVTKQFTSNNVIFFLIPSYCVIGYHLEWEISHDFTRFDHFCWETKLT